MNKIMQTQKKIETAVVGSYKTIENGVVSGYKKVEDAFVAGYKKIEDRFVDAFLTPDEHSPKAGKQGGNSDKEQK